MLCALLLPSLGLGYVQPVSLRANYLQRGPHADTHRMQVYMNAR